RPAARAGRFGPLRSGDTSRPYWPSTVTRTVGGAVGSAQTDENRALAVGCGVFETGLGRVGRLQGAVAGGVGRLGQRWLGRLGRLGRPIAGHIGGLLQRRTG